MSTFTGLATGFIALTALEAVLSSKASAGRVGGIFTSVNAVFQHIADPTIPLLPDHSSSNSSSTVTSSAPLGTPQLSPATVQTSVSL